MLPYWNILTIDTSNNVIESSATVSTFVMNTRMSMWGESMFGHPLLLGTGYINTYVSNMEKNVLQLDLSKNSIRLPVRLLTVTMLTRPGMWGESMFGSEDVLGTGTLNYSDG
jgi:hypothetical protein